MDIFNSTQEAFFGRLKYLEKLNFLVSMKVDDTYSLSLLHPLMIGYPLLPITGASMRPFCLAHIMNDIVVNERKHLIEFGSGISTILIARLISKNGLPSKICTVENDEGWSRLLRNILAEEKLDTIVQVIHAPLTTCDLSADNNEWYDIRVLDQYLEDRCFDMVIIDGPPAWETSKERARYPALPFIFDRLTSKCSVYLDDVNRLGEISVLKSWEKEFDIEFTVTGETLAYFYRGQSLYTEPIVYY